MGWATWIPVVGQIVMACQKISENRRKRQEAKTREAEAKLKAKQLQCVK
jgi:hypothetical protein